MSAFGKLWSSSVLKAISHSPEHMFRTQVLGATISAQNLLDFSSHFSHYLASATYFAVNRDRHPSLVQHP